MKESNFFGIWIFAVLLIIFSVRALPMDSHKNYENSGEMFKVASDFLIREGYFKTYEEISESNMVFGSGNDVVYLRIYKINDYIKIQNLIIEFVKKKIDMSEKGKRFRFVAKFYFREYKIKNESYIFGGEPDFYFEIGE